MTDNVTAIFTVIVSPDKVVRVFKSTVEGDVIEVHRADSDRLPWPERVGEMIEDYLCSLTPLKYTGTTQLGSLTL